MKNILFIVLFSFPLLGLGGCNNNDDSSHDALPAATQTGAGTFACKVNGKTFIDHSSTFNCFYQYVNGGYYFGIQGKNSNENPSSIGFGTYNKTIIEGENLQLIANENGNAWAVAYFRNPGAIGESGYTNLNYTGELTITKFDESTQIVSGTFWFDVQHPVTGETVEIREGRFDTHFGH